MLLIVPVAALVVAYVMPTIRTLNMSLETGSPFGDGEFVGAENFSNVLGDTRFAESLGLGLGLGFGAAVSGAVLAFLVAWCVHKAGRGMRTATNVVAALALVAFAPAAWVIARQIAAFESYRDNGGELATADWSTWGSLVGGVVFGAGLLVGLAAFRGGDDTHRRSRTVLTAAGLTALALVAAGVQTFAFSSITGVQPFSPLLYLYQSGFVMMDFGRSSAIAVLLLAGLAVLGLGAAVLFAAARVRLDVAPGPGEPRPFKIGTGIASILLIGLFAAGTLISLWPWLSRITEGASERFEGTTPTLDTWVPALITTVVAVACAAVGGYAIGALRPAGEASRWLLLPFAPWLFVGTGPLGLAHYQALREAETLGTFAALAPRAWLAVPALFLFTALFWGLEDRKRAMTAGGLAPGAARWTLTRAAWPIGALFFLAVLIANAQDVFWQALSAPSPDHATAWFVMVTSISDHFGNLGETGIGTAYPLALLVPFAAAAAAAAIWVLPKTGIRTGR
ncbi:hypothetical protein AB0B28_05300 [Glycomyces sp. NPDC046736]|uniref:hypothetical protein n=1 Tax=Glycomyces sp. NPDC046736 TaxID=3155615 RepID=UPI00340B8981